jgi:hypothetical protein
MQNKNKQQTIMIQVFQEFNIDIQKHILLFFVSHNLMYIIGNSIIYCTDLNWKESSHAFL